MWERFRDMRFNDISWLAAAGSLALAAGSAQSATQIVDISALGSEGTVVALAAGTYTLSFIGKGSGGLYDAWAPWSFENGCSASGTNCINGWTNTLAVDFGVGGVFTHENGVQYGQLLPGDSLLYETAAQALAAFQPANLVWAPLLHATDNSAYSSAAYPISFTLAAAQSVDFFIFDNPYGDNRGGVSILLDDGISAPGGVPEPASWAMLVAGLGAVGFAMRRRRDDVAFA